MTDPVPLDLHIHLAGTGNNGDGCWFHPDRMNSLAFRYIRHSLGMSREAADADLSGHLVRRLQSWTGKDTPLAAVVLALDWARDEAGVRLQDKTDLYVPNDFVLNLCRASSSLFPGVSIHPYRPGAVEELERCVEAGAVLVKWLPVSQCFSPADDRCRPFYDAMARLDVPLLCHTGSEGATRNYRKDANDPQVLVPALDAGVTVIAAHAGMRSSPHDWNYFDRWLSLTQQYSRLYGDTACWIGLRARYAARVIQREGVSDRLVHGSDWPVPSSPWWFLGKIPLRRILQLSKITNPLLRDLETKRAAGVPDAVFTRAWRLLSHRETRAKPTKRAENAHDDTSG